MVRVMVRVMVWVKVRVGVMVRVMDRVRVEVRVEQASSVRTHISSNRLLWHLRSSQRLPRPARVESIAEVDDTTRDVKGRSAGKR